MQETLFQVAKTPGTCLFWKKSIRQGCPTQNPEWECSTAHHLYFKCIASLVHIYFKFISSLFQSDLSLTWVHFPKIIRKFGWHDPWPWTSSENHTHARVRGSKGAILFWYCILACWSPNFDLILHFCSLSHRMGKGITGSLRGLAPHKYAAECVWGGRRPSPSQLGLIIV